MLQKFKITSYAFIVVFMTVQVFTIPASGIHRPGHVPPKPHIDPKTMPKKEGDRKMAVEPAKESEITEQQKTRRLDEWRRERSLRARNCSLAIREYRLNLGQVIRDIAISNNQIERNRLDNTTIEPYAGCGDRRNLFPHGGAATTGAHPCCVTLSYKIEVNLPELEGCRYVESPSGHMCLTCEDLGLGLPDTRCMD